MAVIARALSAIHRKQGTKEEKCLKEKEDSCN